MKLERVFNLSAYTESYTAERFGYKEQYVPSDEVIGNLEYLHDNITIPLLGVLKGDLHCSSGYRCERTNTAVKGSKTSQHVYGQACDYKYFEKGKLRSDILLKAFLNLSINFDQCIKEFGDDSNPAWIHISLKKEGTNRKQILRIK